MLCVQYCHVMRYEITLQLQSLLKSLSLYQTIPMQSEVSGGEGRAEDTPFSVFLFCWMFLLQTAVFFVFVDNNFIKLQFFAEVGVY